MVAYGRIPHDAFIAYPSELIDEARAIYSGIRRIQGHRRLLPWKRLDIFMDEENLAGNPALWDELVAHLRGSRHLIVITYNGLDPASYVHKELRAWLDHHGDPHRILAVLGRGKLQRVAADGRRIQNPPPFDGAPFDSFDFEIAIVEVQKHDERSRLKALFRVPPRDPRRVHARIVASITGRDPETVLRQHRRWVLGLTLFLSAAVAFFLAGQWRSISAEADLERAMATQLQQTELIGDGFVGKALRDATYVSKRFDNADFSDSAINNITIRDSSGVNVRFDRANLKGVKFEGAIFSRSEFSCGDILAVELGESCTGATITDVKILAGSRFDGANFDFAHVSDLRVQSSSLNAATFVGTSGRNVVIADSDIRNAIFGQSSIGNLSFVRVCHNKKTVWPSGLSELPKSYARSCK